MEDFQKVSGEHLAGGVIGIRRAGAQIQQTLDQLDAALLSLAASWTGEASDAHQSAQEAWNRSAQQMNEILSSFANALEEAHDSFSDAQRQVTNIWS